jgi:hypothetical protein
MEALQGKSHEWTAFDWLPPKTEALIGGALSAKVLFMLSYWLMLQTNNAFPNRSGFYNRFVN